MPIRSCISSIVDLEQYQFPELQHSGPRRVHLKVGLLKKINIFGHGLRRRAMMVPHAAQNDIIASLKIRVGTSLGLGSKARILNLQARKSFLRFTSLTIAVILGKPTLV